MKKSSWTDILIAILGISGLVLALVFYKQAFPDAAIQMKFSRTEVIDLAQKAIQKLGNDVSSYKFALTFNEAFLESVYLQRTLGIQATNALLQQETLPIYYWYARWYIPLQKEEYSMLLAPSGTLVGFLP
jgi:hypothetical protein